MEASLISVRPPLLIMDKDTKDLIIGVIESIDRLSDVGERLIESNTELSDLMREGLGYEPLGDMKVDSRLQ